MRWIRAILIMFSFAMLTGAAAYIFCQNILPGLNLSTKDAKMFVPLTGCLGQEDKVFEAGLLQMINAQRRSQGIPDLALDPSLDLAAQGHSRDMGCNHFFNHTNLDGQTLYDRIKAQNYVYSSAAEVIFAGSGAMDSPSEALKAWLDNSVYKNHLLNPAFSQVGIGAVHNPAGAYSGYFTVVFASPAH